jgi:hypothetical protein
MSIENKNSDNAGNDLRDRNYRLHFKHQNGVFYFILPDLSLYSSNVSLEKAYKGLVEKKELLFKDAESTGTVAEIPYPSQLGIKSDLKNQLKLFSSKLLIFSLLFGFAFAISASFFVDKVSKIPIADIVKNQLSPVLSILGNKINQVSDDEKKLRIIKLRSFVDNMKPYVNELQPLFPKRVDLNESGK